MGQGIHQNDLETQLTNTVAQAVDSGTPLKIVGGGSKSFYGNPVEALEAAVIGTWTCRGWHVGEGIKTAPEDPLVITTQTFDFGEAPGEEMIVTDGFELFNDTPIKRPIIGGSCLVPAFDGSDRD